MMARTVGPEESGPDDEDTGRVAPAGPRVGGGGAQPAGRARGPGDPVVAPENRSPAAAGGRHRARRTARVLDPIRARTVCNPSRPASGGRVALHVCEASVTEHDETLHTGSKFWSVRCQSAVVSPIFNTIVVIVGIAPIWHVI